MFKASSCIAFPHSSFFNPIYIQMYISPFNAHPPPLSPPHFHLQTQMGINIELYRAAIGRFHFSFGKKSLLSSLYFWFVLFPNIIDFNWVLPTILKQCNDLECNPGPSQILPPAQPLKQDNYRISYVNMKSIKAPVLDPDYRNTKKTTA